MATIIACSSITSGLSAVACGTNRGGISHIYLANLASITFVSSTGGTVSGITGGSGAFYDYALRPNTSSAQYETTKDLNTGSLFYTETLNFLLAKMDKTKRDQLALLDNSLCVAIVLDANGLYWMYGHGLGTEGDGIYVTTNVATSGVNRTDGNGYTITMVAQESNPPYPVDPSIVAALIAP